MDKLRPIKFRGYNKKRGEWLYGSHILNRGSHFIAPDEFAEGRTWEDYEVTLESIGQFTGLTDKNGTPIYEGDVIKVREYENLLMKEFSDEPNRFDMFTIEEIRGELLKEYISPVFFDEGGFLITTCQGDYDMWLACLFGDMKRSSPSFDFEVIGNVHDNKGLLEKGGNDDPA